MCIVADRGMISDATMAEIESRGWFYILGVRMRHSKQARDEVRGGRYRTVHAKSDDPKAPSPLQVKEVRVSDDDPFQSRHKRNSSINLITYGQDSTPSLSSSVDWVATAG